VRLRFLLTAILSTALLAPAQTAPPPAKRAAASKAAPSAVPPYKRLQFPPIKEVKVTAIATFTLSNGMKLFLLENHSLPLVSGFALVRTGNLFDPPDKVGLAEITGTVMRTGGTRTKTGDQLNEQLENIAASVESGIGETSGSVRFSALKENTDEVLAVFKDVLTQPEFRQDKIDLIKMQLRGVISRRNDNASSIASREFNELVYGRNNPYGWRMEYEHLDRIQRDDLVNFHKRYFFPANTMLAIQGDFDTAEMKSKIEALFADWKVQQPPVPKFPEVTAKPAPGVYLAIKDDVNQTFFRVGHLGGTLRDKDYPALEVAVDILAGGFSSRLFRKVRTELGYAYGISGSWAAQYNHPGVFVIGGSTKSASTTDTLQVIREEIERIRTSEVTDLELQTAKETVLNSFVFNFDQPAKTLNRMVTYEYFGYPKDFIFRYQDAIKAVTKEDIRRVAQQHLKPEDLTIVAVGKPSDFGKPLTALGLPVKTIDLTIPEPKEQQTKVDAASMAAGRKLMAHLQQAVGGASKIEAVKDVVRSADSAVNSGQNQLKISQTLFWIRPSHLRQEQILPFGKMVVYSDGTTGWMQGPQGTQPMPAVVINQVKTELFRFPFLLWLSDRDTSRTVSASGENVVDISGPGVSTVRLTIDAQTGLPKEATYRLGAMENRDVYEDWKETDGLKLPYKVTTYQGDRKAVEMTVKEWKLNTGLTQEEVSRKP